MFIGEIILQRRKELNMTQKELAEKLNVTDRTISRWECGVSLPDVEMLKTVGFAVAMENGHPRVKEIADYITVTNDEDGVAKAIEKFALQLEE